MNSILSSTSAWVVVAASSPSSRSWADRDCRHRSSMLVASSDSCASPSSPLPPLSGCLRRRLLTAAGASGVNSIGLTDTGRPERQRDDQHRSCRDDVFVLLATVPPLAVLVARHRAARHLAAPVSHGVRTRLDERRTSDVAPFARVVLAHDEPNRVPSTSTNAFAGAGACPRTAPNRGWPTTTSRSADQHRDRDHTRAFSRPRTHSVLIPVAM
jgi:hypothetical protein